MSTDIEKLTVLNRDYVASVQNSDVKRFDEILARDFYCTNPDKSLVDVKIRVLGDFASSTAAPVTLPRTVNRPTVATPIAGRNRMAAGSRYWRMCRGRFSRRSSLSLPPRSRWGGSAVAKRRPGWGVHRLPSLRRHPPPGTSFARSRGATLPTARAGGGIRLTHRT